MTPTSRRRLILVGGFCLALALRLWYIGTPPTLVSDEVFFVRDAQQYLVHQTYFDPHPPLGKLLIGGMIAIFGDTPTAWRSLNAVLGAVLLPLMWTIVWLLTRRERAANLTLLLLLFDGLTLVDGRLGMINLPYIVFGFGAVAALVYARRARRPLVWLAVAGTALGLSVATKWLGLLVAAPAFLWWRWPQWFGLPSTTAKVSVKQFLWWLIGWPLCLYAAVFAVHFAWLHATSAFWTTNIQMLNYHLSVPSVGDPHAQPWWGWLFAWRPFQYWSATVDGRTSAIMSLANPWLWWSGVMVMWWAIVRAWRQTQYRTIVSALLLTWLPFALIHRVMYSYHTMPFDIWLIALLGVWLSSRWERRRWLVVGWVALTAVIWFWFLPWYLNLPLSPEALRWREWLPSWRVTL